MANYVVPASILVNASSTIRTRATALENVTALELDMPEKTTQDFDGPTMASRVDPVLGMSINDDDGDDIEFASDAISVHTCGTTQSQVVVAR